MTKRKTATTTSTAAQTLAPARLRSPLKGHGSKHYLADWIVGLLPPRETYSTFVDAMCRTGAVLLAHDPTGKVEVINDLDHRIMNFWRCVQDPKLFQELRFQLEVTPFSEIEFKQARSVLERFSSEEARKMFALGQADVEYARAFFIVARQSLAGREACFATITRTRLRRGMNEQVSAWLSAIDLLDEAHERMQQVAIKCEDVLTLIPKMADPETVFYCDPPYHPATRTAPNAYMELDWTHEKHEAFLNLVLELAGKKQGMFLISGYMCELYQDRLNGWHRHERKIANHASGAKAKKTVTECVWTNY